MSDEAAETTEKPEGGAAPKAAGPSKLVPILLVVNLLATGAGVFFTLKAKPAVAAVAAEHEKSDKPGPVVGLDPFIVNLNEPSAASRYLKTTFEVELANPHAAEELTARKRDVRDVALRYLSSLSVSDTLGEANKDKIQSEIVARMDKELGGGKVKRVFFSEFVVQ